MNKDGVWRERKWNLFLGVDNRIIPQTDFHREGLAASFQHYITELIAKLFMLSHQHSWIPSNHHVLGAGSPCTATVLPLRNSDRVSSVLNMMEPRFSILGGNLSADSTWSNFLVSMISETMKAMSNNTEDKVLLVMYTTDFVLFGDGSNDQLNIVDGMKKFLQICSDICQALRFLEIRLVVVDINCKSQSHQESSYPACSSYHEIFFHEVATRKLPIKLDFLCVSSLQFDHELRHILALVLPSSITTIDLRPGHDPCKLYVSLVPHTIPAADCVSHMSHMEYCGVSHRSGINPLFLAGYGLEVKAPNKMHARDQQIKEQQLQNNSTLLEALKMWMAMHDIVLIVKVPYTFPGETRACSKYWALVPPAISPGQQTTDHNMALMLLTDRDQLLSHDSSYSVEFNAGSADRINSSVVIELFTAFQQLLSNLIATPEVGKNYNPWMLVGGSFNAQFDLFRRPETDHSVKSHSTHSMGLSFLGKGQSDESEPPQLMPSASVAKLSAVLIPPPLPRSSTSNANDTKKGGVEEYTRNASNIENIATMKPPKGRARKVPVNLEKSSAIVNGNTSRSSSSKKSSSVLPTAATNSALTGGSNPSSSKTVEQRSIAALSITHAISMMPAVELAEVSHIPFSSPKRPERQSSSIIASAKSAVTNVATLHENEHRHCDIANDENLFQVVPSSRPRFLKRKYSNLNKQKCTSVEANGSSARIVGSDGTAIRKETIVDNISSDEEFPC